MMTRLFFIAWAEVAAVSMDTGPGTPFVRASNLIAPRMSFPGTLLVLRFILAARADSLYPNLPIRFNPAFVFTSSRFVFFRNAFRTLLSS
jgi:hypothetical protein